MASTYIFKHLTKFMTLSPGPATRGACGYDSVLSQMVIYLICDGLCTRTSHHMLLPIVLHMVVPLCSKIQ